ncbi:TlpA disulfide reductase family protein [Ammonicoccus fulvus]|uniref:TlpA disulfide reductase family protein n=1 Tax=Ammonicoccus fulvus TaxID=3138240 RepID=A0ABZ3FME4_9ACTN
MSGRRRYAGPVAAFVVLLLAACGGSPVGPATSASGPAEETRGPAGTAHVLEQRRAAGIADCPTSDADVPARADGLPDLTLDCLGADSRVRLAGLRGQPLVINVWAQWCGPCRAEAPFLTEAATRAGDRVGFLGIDYDDPKPELAVEFAQQAGWRYPQLVDPDKSIGPDLRIIGPPQTILVDADGRIAYRHPGQVTSTDQLLELIDKHLGVAL